jgi:CRISPR-associated exonuclease Cas4
LGIVLLLGALLVLAFGVWIRLRVRKDKKAHGVPEGTILYSDLNVPAAALFSRRFGLVGKPDYIVQKEKGYVPVEVKSGRGLHPQQNHIFQLAAYCQLLEDASGEFVPEGVLVYNNVPYTIAFDPKMRFDLESVMSSMRDSLKRGLVRRNHEEAGRCRHCSMRRYCSDPLL